MPSIINRFNRDEDFTSIQELQAGATRLLERANRNGTYYRVLKNNKPVGVLLSNTAWEDFLEDLEALSSPNYKRSIALAKRQKKRLTVAQVKKHLGL